MITAIDIQGAKDILDNNLQHGLSQILIMESHFQKEGQGVLLLSPKDYQQWKEKNPELTHPTKESVLKSAKEDKLI